MLEDGFHDPESYLVVHFVELIDVVGRVVGQMQYIVQRSQWSVFPSFQK